MTSPQKKRTQLLNKEKRTIPQPEGRGILSCVFLLAKFALKGGVLNPSAKSCELCNNKFGTKKKTKMVKKASTENIVLIAVLVIGVIAVYFLFSGANTGKAYSTGLNILTKIPQAETKYGELPYYNDDASRKRTQSIKNDFSIINPIENFPEGISFLRIVSTTSDCSEACNEKGCTRIEQGTTRAKTGKYWRAKVTYRGGECRSAARCYCEGGEMIERTFEEVQP